MTTQHPLPMALKMPASQPDPGSQAEVVSLPVHVRAPPGPTRKDGSPSRQPAPCQRASAGRDHEHGEPWLLGQERVSVTLLV